MVECVQIQNKMLKCVNLSQNEKNSDDFPFYKMISKFGTTHPLIWFTVQVILLHGISVNDTWCVMIIDNLQ